MFPSNQTINNNSYYHFIIYFIIFILFLFIFSFFISSIISSKYSFYINSFIQTSGYITDCNIKHHNINHSSRYGIYVNYIYSVNNIPYYGSDLYDSVSSLDSAKHICNLINNTYSVPIYYDPNNFSISVVNRGFLYLITYISYSVMIVLFIILLYFIIFNNNLLKMFSNN